MFQGSGAGDDDESLIYLLGTFGIFISGTDVDCGNFGGTDESGYAFLGDDVHASRWRTPQVHSWRRPGHGNPSWQENC